MKKLKLCGNPLKKLTPRIAELINLEELSLSDTGIKMLPVEIGQLKNLKILSLNGNELFFLPEEMAQLSNLRNLYFTKILAELPQLFIEKTKLQVVSLGYLTEEAKGVFEFKKLKKISIRVFLKQIGDDFLKLNLLEELEIVTLAEIQYITDLSKLHNLRTLTLIGNRIPFPANDFLLRSEIWNIPSLEEINLINWGKQEQYNSSIQKYETVFNGIITLPNEAFDKMPKLKKITISGAKLKTLPESFFRLKNLKEVNLPDADLEKKTMQRIVEVFSDNVKFDVRRSNGLEDQNCNSEVNRLYKEGEILIKEFKYKEAIKKNEQAIILCRKFLFAFNAQMFDCLYQLFGSLRFEIKNISGKEREKIILKLINHSKQILELFPHPEKINIHTKNVGFQKLLVCAAGNNLGELLLEIGHAEQALADVERAILCIDNDIYCIDIYNTKVRILLKLGRNEEAYEIIYKIQKIYPSFLEFKYFNEDEDYLNWQKNK